MAKATNSPKNDSSAKKTVTLKSQMKANKTIQPSRTEKMETPASPETEQTKTSPATPQQLSPEQREEMVRYAAYHIAEKDGFQQGREQDYWFQAQSQIDQLLGGGANSSQEQH